MKRIMRFLFGPALVIAAWFPLGWTAEQVVLVPDADGVQRATLTVTAISLITLWYERGSRSSSP